MSISQITTDTTGQIGVNPRFVKIVCTDDYDTITTANYLHGAQQEGYSFLPTDFFAISYVDSGIPLLGIFTATFSTGVITLLPYVQEGSAELPTIVNYIAKFSNTDGKISDAASIGYNQGAFASLSPTASKGSLQLIAADSAANTITAITNHSMGQATTLTLPDPGAASAKILVTPSTVLGKVLCGTTAVYAGGGTQNTFTVTGLTSSYIGITNLRVSTNTVAFQAVPASNSLVVTFASDPGAGTFMDYFYVL